MRNSRARRRNPLLAGFTLIELLVVLSVISLLSSIILSALTSARARAVIVANQASLRSLAPELVACANDGGVAWNAGAPIGNVTYVCQDPVSGNAAGSNVNLAGHTVTFPALQGNWSYLSPSGSLSSDNYVYAVVAPASGPGGIPTVLCQSSSSSCKSGVLAPAPPLPVPGFGI